MLTLIIGRSYAQGIAWLRDNKRKPGIDPQRCRIVTNFEMIKGLPGFKVIYLPSWDQSPAYKYIREEIQLAKMGGRCVSEEYAR